MTYPCGHPRTDENTQSVGVANGYRCRTCRRKTARESARELMARGVPVSLDDFSKLESTPGRIAA